MTAGTIRSCFSIVVPGRIGHQGPAFDPVHEIVWRGNEIHFINSSLHQAKVRTQMEHEGCFQFASMAHSTAGSRSIFSNNFIANSPGSVKEGGGAEYPSVSPPCIL